MVQNDTENLPRHIAIIMDGNGRWAKKRGLKRVLGHQKGVDAVRTVVKTTRRLEIPWLTLYAFSEENWSRPKLEVQALMSILRRFLQSERQEMIQQGIRLQTIGRTDKLPAATRDELAATILATAENNDLVLTLALSYGGRQEIVDAARAISHGIETGALRASDISEELFAKYLYVPEMPDPDLLIRTSGEYRISNFLLWQIAYSEIYITPTLWPDFSEEEYIKAIRDYQRRERRFGGTNESD
ncbi:isoprenyl transferase [Desulfatiglans anilini]|uniref:isoprenyl transferase n=1 Tax=Desulfatiglans anilini TaxID=90728 RepID=UPI00040D91E7|nr:isoprenyl transferase [Desulfatiglans anilini]